MSTEKTQHPEADIHSQGEAIVINDRFAELECQVAESKKRDDEYKREQLALDRRMVQLTAILVLFTAVLGGVGLYQSYVSGLSVDAAQAAAAAAAANARTAHYTLKEIQKGSADTHELAVQAKNQADRTKDLADRTHDQAIASKHAADAATSAADTAKEALHVSERAYVTEGNVVFDLDNLLIKVPISNTGHIPSGETGITIHEAVANRTDPLRPTQNLPIADCHWKHFQAQSVAVGTPHEITIPIEKADGAKVISDTQQIVVAGFIDYNDGFPDTPPRDWPFCDRTIYQPATKTVIIGPCDPAIYIQLMVRCDRYPANEEQ